jgi:malonyl-CoA O-methyltransferase
MHKEKTRAAFHRAAPRYDQYAVLQKTAAQELAALVSEQPSSVLDLGCGTGECVFQVHKKFPEAELYGIDFAEGMITAAQKRSITEKVPEAIFTLGDLEHIPYPDESFDCLLSGLAIQWLPILEKSFSEMSRVLKPEGRVYLSTLLPGSLKELAGTYAAIFGDYPQAHPFHTTAQIKKTLSRVGIQVLQAKEVKKTFYFKSFSELIKSITAIGAKTENPQKLTKLQVKKLTQTYPKGFPLTYTLIYIEAVRILS